MPDQQFQKNLNAARTLLAELREPDPVTSQLIAQSRDAIRDSYRALRRAPAGSPKPNFPEDG